MVAVEVFIARQAILDRKQRLFGYELLFRPCRQGTADVVDDSSSTLQVLSNTLLSSGLPALCGASPVFINFGRELLVSHWTSLFPPDSVVIEILESVKADPEVVAACVELKKKGYCLALDDVTEQVDPELLELADFVKIDFLASSRETQAQLATLFHKAGKRLLAEKIETQEEFLWAKELGFEFFQGFFFAKPVLLEGRQVPTVKGSALRLLMEIRHPDLDFHRLELLIKCDVSLTYKLLRYANSALFGRSRPISAVRDALVVLGELDVRRWVVLATLLDLSAGTTQVLILHALVRARFCETLAIAARLSCPSDLFLIGMFSLLDALAHRPLPELLGDLALPKSIVEPLLGERCETAAGTIYHIARQYEAADWPTVGLLIESLDLPEQIVSDLYLEAVNWAGLMLSAGGIQVKHESSSRPSSGGNLRALQESIAPPRPNDPYQVTGSQEKLR